MRLTMDDSRQLERMVEAVADGRAIDWHSASLDRQGLRKRLERLKLIETIGSVHRRSVSAAGLPFTTGVISLPGRSGSGTTADGGFPSPDSPPVSWGPLKILERIGSGGYGEVFRAHDPNLKLDVALKLPYVSADDECKEEIDESFLKESRALARVQHENVLTVHGADRHDGRVGMWTELVHGLTLEQCLTQRGAFGQDEAAQICMKVCQALAAVHAAGLVHGDVKASNVMRESRTGKIILMDFSSARRRRRPEDEPGSICGTLMYMAPELLDGRDAGVQSDVYSLGALLYRLVTHRLPVEAASVRELRRKIREGAMVPLREIRPDLDAEFIRIVEKALAIDPASRYASVAALERDLGRMLVPIAPSIRIWQAVVAAAVVAAGAFGYYWVNRPLEMKARLMRETGAFSQVLNDAAKVRTGDKLRLLLDSNRSMYTYVLNKSENEDPIVLFPARNAPPALPAGPTELPGRIADQRKLWKVGQTPGRIDLFVVASREPLPDLEETLRSLRHLDEPAPIPGIRRRSIDSLSDAPQTVPDLDRLTRILSELKVEDEAGDGGIVVWQLQLDNVGGAAENPAPNN